MAEAFPGGHRRSSPCLVHGAACLKHIAARWARGGELRPLTQLSARVAIEIGTSFGPLAGRIWRMGTMGYTCRKRSVLLCLMALETVLRSQGFRAPPGEAVDAALRAWDAA